MDLTSLMGALLSDSSVQSVSNKAGVSGSDAVSVLAAALPALLNGANAQASNADTAESFHAAVTEHAAKDPEKVDVSEGEKIVEHLLGADAEKTEKAIAKKTGLSKAQIALILAAAAPLIMNMLGQHTTASNSSSSSSTASILGSLLGGSSNSSSSNSLMTAALGAVLGGALGTASGSSSSSGSSILSSVLSSAMGGSTQQSSSAASSLLGSLLGGSTQQSSSSSDLLGGLLNMLK